MKVKRLREDFVVNELSTFSMGGGKHAVYRLEKQGIGTPEAVQEILKIWNLPSQCLSYGGLKDRHATTSQTVTIVDGPPSNLEQPGFKLTFVGRAQRPFTARDIVANQFDITLRGLSAPAAESVFAVWQSADLAIPNYFDEQRFGSLGESGQFVAHAWCLQNYERALFLAIAEANPHDRSRDREQKRILREHWGEWQVCKEQLDRSHRRSIVTYLVDHPAGFKKALALVRRDLRSIFVGAFQAYLWNELVSRKLKTLLPADCLHSPHNDSENAVARSWVWPLDVARPIADELRYCRIPLPSGRKTAWQPQDRQQLEQILSELAMHLHQLRLSYPRDVFFSRGMRDMMLDPQRLNGHLADDELASPGFQKLRLEFRLKPGQYATMLIKGLQRRAKQAFDASTREFENQSFHTSRLATIEMDMRRSIESWAHRHKLIVFRLGLQVVKRTRPVKLRTIAYCIALSLLNTNVALAQSTPQFQPRTGGNRATNSQQAVSQDLLRIYAQTGKATSEAAITALARACSRIVPDDRRSKTDRDYAARLLAWALNRRGEMRSERAARLVEQGKLAEASTLDQQAALDFETAIQFAASNWRSHHNLAISLAMKGDYPRAIDELSTAIDLNPDYANAYFNRAELYFEQADYERALQDYSRSVELNPDDPQYFNSRGHCRFMLEAYDEALVDYQRAVELGSDSVVYHTDLADTLQFLGQWEAAARAYRAALTVNSNYARAYQNASWLMATSPDAEIRNVDLALSAAKKAMELGGERSARMLDTLAAATAAVGRYAEAAELERRALQIADEEVRAEMAQRLELYAAGKPYVQPRPLSQSKGRGDAHASTRTASGETIAETR